MESNEVIHGEDAALRGEVFGLASAICDGTSTAKDMARLNELLATTREARDYYREATGLHIGLQFRFESAGELLLSEEEEFDTIPEPAVQPARRGLRMASPRGSRLVLVLSLVLGVAIVAGAALSVWLKQTPLEGRIASLHLDEPCVWGPAGDDLADGASIALGRRLELQQGAATLSYDSGAVLIIEAPAVIHLLSAESVRVESGRVLARVPPPAAGFTVITPTARIIDLGTEFGVHVVDPQQTQVGVFVGSAECFALNDGGVARDRTLLSAGEALTVDHLGIQPLPDFENIFRRHRLVAVRAAAHWRFEEAVAPPPANGSTQHGVIGDASGHGRVLDYWSGDDVGGIGRYRWSSNVPPNHMFMAGFSGGSRSFDNSGYDPDMAGVLSSSAKMGEYEMLGEGFTLEGFFMTRGDMSAAEPMMLVYQGEKYFSYEVMLNDTSSGSFTSAIHGSVTNEAMDVRVALEDKNFADGKWHYFVARFYPAGEDEAGRLTVTVVDQGLHAHTATEEVPAGFKIASSARPLLLGRLQYFLDEPRKAHFVGLLDEIRISDSPLADSELMGLVPRSEL